MQEALQEAAEAFEEIAEEADRPERLLDDADILALLPENCRDTVGVTEVQRWLDRTGDSKIRSLHTLCSSIYVLWETQDTPGDVTTATLAQFWRYAEIVGLQHIGSLAELSRREQ